MTNKMTILQVAKIAFFSKHCHFFVIFLSFFNQFSIFFHTFEKIAPKRQKMTNFPPNDKNDKFAGCKNCIFLEALSFVCHFSVIFQSVFDIFHTFEKIAPKRQKMTNFPPNDKNMTNQN